MYFELLRTNYSELSIIIHRKVQIQTLNHYFNKLKRIKINAVTIGCTYFGTDNTFFDFLRRHRVKEVYINIALSK